MKYGYPTLFRNPIWVVLPSDKDVKFLLKPLSYAEVFGYNESLYANQNSDSYMSKDPHTFIYTNIIDFAGIKDCPSVEAALTLLSIQDKTFLESKILEYSMPTSEQLSNLDMLVRLILEPSLQDKTYNCTKCKEIPGMQQARNCPLINHTSSKFKLRINDYTYTQCPIASIDIYCCNQIIKANDFMAMNTLPITGGIGEQSVWFVEAVHIYRRVHQEYMNKGV